MSLDSEAQDQQPVQTGPDSFERPNSIFIGPPSTWQVVSRPCADGQHNLVPDESEAEFEAEKCTRCPYGRLLRRKAEVSKGD